MTIFDIVERIENAIEEESYIDITVSTKRGTILSVIGIVSDIRSNRNIIEIDMEEGCGATLNLDSAIITEEDRGYCIATNDEVYYIEFAS